MDWAVTSQIHFPCSRPEWGHDQRHLYGCWRNKI